MAFGTADDDMADEKRHPDRFHFRELKLRNVRAFAAEQRLDLTGLDGQPSRWTLILGENGVGKTTIMQSLARMRPVPAFNQTLKSTKAGGDAGVPEWTGPELSEHENEEIRRFIRLDDSKTSTIRTSTIRATLETPDHAVIEVGVTCSKDGTELTNVEFAQTEHELASNGPLLIGYGAARHVGHGNGSVVGERDPASPLFSDAIDLFDAEEIFERMHHASLTMAKPKDRRDAGNDKVKLTDLKKAVADLIPGMKPGHIEIRGPKVPGRSASDSGVHVSTPSGVVPLTDLSLGYQTVFAWTVDLAWRMFSAYPASPHPLRESAIVLIDEVDLHLHPRWQRIIRRHLTKHFPGVQFIATTHSPVTAQETLSAGGNVAVVRWENDHTVILNKPLPPREWRFDQLLTSELFAFDSSRGPEAETLMNERLALIRKETLSAGEKRRLKKLDDYAAKLPTAPSPQEQAFEDLMRSVARLEGIPAPAR
ncbi:AAA family ATPase [Methylobacterium durans]|uniref:ATPase n=1 Tax=Methylobacterium durans TaxID=2202825 RepID=A0A2U8WB27_9HYPH|nr:AAA family ATPase [Methylobacterium durans]AWN42516.1 ATPase [Methylobacterium durans]